MFKATEGKGFQMTFENGWTVSVQFGPGNYCENKMLDFIDFANKEFANKTSLTSKDAEIAAWDKEGNWYNFGNDTVSGYMSTEEVADFIKLISRFDKLEAFK